MIKVFAGIAFALMIGSAHAQDTSDLDRRCNGGDGDIKACDQLLGLTDNSDWAKATELMTDWSTKVKACHPSNSDLDYDACDNAATDAVFFLKAGFCYAPEMNGWYSCRWKGEEPKAWIEKVSGLRQLVQELSSNILGDQESLYYRRLTVAGWCYGKTTQPSSDYKWHRCSKTSIKIK